MKHYLKTVCIKFDLRMDISFAIIHPELMRENKRLELDYIYFIVSHCRLNTRICQVTYMDNMNNRLPS